MRTEESQTIDEDLVELEHKIQRLKIEYDQYFMGAMKREPILLRGEVQRLITKYVNEPPINARQKFRFNTLCSRFQAYRTLWGRAMREIEAGTYKSHRFKAALHEAEQAPAEAPQAADGTADAGAGEAPAAKKSPVDRIYASLMAARQKTGETGELNRAKLEAAVRKQTEALRAQHPDAKISFRIVIENNKAKLKVGLRSA
jgi:hypothetical protein